MQSYSKRVANAKSDKYHSNVHKRGKVWDGKEASLCFLQCAILASIWPCKPVQGRWTSLMQGDPDPAFLVACRSLRPSPRRALGCWASSFLCWWAQVRLYLLMPCIVIVALPHTWGPSCQLTAVPSLLRSHSASHQDSQHPPPPVGGLLRLQAHAEWTDD